MDANKRWPCEHIVSGVYNQVRCISLALKGHRYCAVHKRQAMMAQAAKKTKRDLDLDVLPWTDGERAARRLDGKERNRPST